MKLIKRPGRILDRLLSEGAAADAASAGNDAAMSLELAADHEERICLIELGIEEV